MQFRRTYIAGVFIVEIEGQQDERGFFARTYCAQEFAAQGLAVPVAQCSLSFNHRSGTVRGLHYQVPPAAEGKLVRCTRGAIYDVVVDMRPSSPTYLSWTGVELSADNHRAIYVPEMVAHGFQTLTDGTEIFYQMSEFYAADYARGIRYDDPLLGVKWPLPASVISAKDMSWPLLGPEIGGRDA
jgi:dTDP-4-dehydrorhamnose 3,5-epimerase